jgi:SAM-dependent methyltransferase
MELSEKDKNDVRKRYVSRFREFGYSPKTLGWDKGKQDIRFDILTSQADLTGKSVLDIGCGFGDLNLTLKRKFGNYRYTGIDLVEELIEKGKEIYNKRNVSFICDDFLKIPIKNEYDYAVASGMFNFKIKEGDNYDFIENCIKKALSVCSEGLAFDFLSDKVDYQYDLTFHSNPEEILRIAYKYSRNIILRNDYMPFEFSLFIFKDDSYEKDTTIFSRYKDKMKS